MAEIVIPINTLNDTAQDFDVLFNLYRKIATTEQPNLNFDFSNCTFLQQNAVAFLGGLIGLAHSKKAESSVKLGTLKPQIHRHLENNGFLNRFFPHQYPNKPNSTTAIPYREDRKNNSAEYTHYLLNQWLGRGWVAISNELKNYIVTHVIEAYLNVFDHAQSPIGVITCGQFYPNLQLLKIAILDFGVGIPNSVRQYLEKPDMTPEQCLMWAFEANNTTKAAGRDAISRGVGLKQLKSFIPLNEGTLEIYSDHGYVCIDRTGEKFINRPNGFQGTCVQITLKCDTQFYKMPTEPPANDHVWF